MLPTGLHPAGRPLFFRKIVERRNEGRGARIMRGGSPKGTMISGNEGEGHNEGRARPREPLAPHRCDVPNIPSESERKAGSGPSEQGFDSV